MNNPGFFTAAVEVGRKFIPKGDIVSIKEDGERTYSFILGLTCLAFGSSYNEGSARLEIAAGAIKAISVAFAR